MPMTLTAPSSTFCTLIPDALSKPPTLLSRGPCPCGIGRMATARFCVKACFVSLCKRQGPYHGQAAGGGSAAQETL